MGRGEQVEQDQDGRSFGSELLDAAFRWVQPHPQRLHLVSGTEGEAAEPVPLGFALPPRFLRQLLDELSLYRRQIHGQWEFRYLGAGVCHYGTEAGSISEGSLLLTFPTRLSTGHTIMSSAR